MKSLVVDDSKPARKVLARYLQHIGFEIEEAQDGKEAIEKLNADDYDLTTLDWNMPGMDGIDVLKHLKEQGKQLPILMISAKNDLSYVESAMQEGAGAYMVKPYKLEQLKDKINEIFAKFDKPQID